MIYRLIFKLFELIKFLNDETKAAIYATVQVSDTRKHNHGTEAGYIKKFKGIRFCKQVFKFLPAFAAFYKIPFLSSLSKTTFAILK